MSPWNFLCPEYVKQQLQSCGSPPLHSDTEKFSDPSLLWTRAISLRPLILFSLHWNKGNKTEVLLFKCANNVFHYEVNSRTWHWLCGPWNFVSFSQVVLLLWILCRLVWHHNTLLGLFPLTLTLAPFKFCVKCNDSMW